MSIVPQKLNISDWDQSVSQPTANLNVEDIKGDLGLQELFMFAPTTNKFVINKPSVKINHNKVIRQPTTITAKNKPYGRDTATSTISMNFDTKSTHFGFNQDYLKQNNNNRQFGFKPLYAKVGENEVPIEENVIVDSKRLGEISMALSQQADEVENVVGTSPLFHFDKETSMIQTVDQNGQSIQVDIHEMPENLQEKILDLEKKAVDKLNDVIQDEDSTQEENVYLDPWIYVEEKEKHEIVDLILPYVENAQNTDNKE